MMKNRVQLRNNQDVMTVTEVAAFLKVGNNAIRRWTREGKLHGYRLGGNGDWRFLEADVMNFLYGKTAN
jgi:excisionase family DNA binding protein